MEKQIIDFLEHVHIVILECSWRVLSAIVVKYQSLYLLV